MGQIGKVFLRDGQLDLRFAFEGFVVVEFYLECFGRLGLVPVEVDVLAVADNGGHIGRLKAAGEVKFLDERLLLAGDDASQRQDRQNKGIYLSHNQ